MIICTKCVGGIDPKTRSICSSCLGTPERDEVILPTQAHVAPPEKIITKVKKIIKRKKP